MRSSTAKVPKELLDLPFDLFERYELTRRLVGELYPDGRGEGLNILDVGGHSSPLKQFFPRQRVFLADIRGPGSLTHLPLAYDGYVQGTGTALPFEGGAFDVVTAHDTLEHVPSVDRPGFLSELFRVAGRFVIVNGPVSLPESEWAEQRLSTFLERTTGTPNGYLLEHRRLGLPRREDIEEIVGAAGLPFIRIPNGNLWIWLTLNAAKTYVQLGTADSGVEAIIDNTANRVLAMADLRGTRYRDAFVVAVDPADVSLLQRVERHLRWEPVVEDRDALAEAFTTMEDQVAALRRRETTLGEPSSLEPVLRAVALTILAAVGPHLEAEANLERLLSRFKDERTKARPALLRRMARKLRPRVAQAAPWGTRRRSIVQEPLEALRVLRSSGWGAFVRHVLAVRRWVPRLWQPAIPRLERFERLTGEEQYEFWLRQIVLSPRRLRAMRRHARRFRYQPVFSIVMPVHNPRPEWLRDAVECVRNQVYPQWELCIADDASSRQDVLDVLREYEADPRIRIAYLDSNLGIAGASNVALRQASGEYVAFLDHDDVLKPNALFEVAKLLNASPHLDYVYSDEDKQELDGRLVAHFFKPDWSPDLLMSVNYVTHFSVYRRSLLEHVGGFRSGFEGSQDYDLVLRVTEVTDRVGHVPLPLYSWRKVPGSAAASLDFKDYAWEAGRKALSEAAQRRGYDATVTPALVPHRYRVRYRIKGNPRVTIIVPTRDKVDLLEQCVSSVRALTNYGNHELVVIDNDSRDLRTREYLSSLDERVIPYPHPFNYSRLINFAVAEVGETDFLLFLNNDTEVISPEWLESLVEHGQRPEVGVVGARLLFRDETPQHEGILVGPSGGLPMNIDHRGTYDLDRTVRNCSAVTFACALVRPETYWAVGGLDESYQVAFQDVDFCLRAGEKGYWTVYTPHALLYHDEGGTRGRTGRTYPDDDARLFRDRWAEYQDPFYNPNFDFDRLFHLQIDPDRLPHLRMQS